MADITITVTEIVDAVSVESTPTQITVTDGVFVDSGAGGGGAVASVNGETGVVVLSAADVGAATTVQGAKADTAVQPGALAAVATTGAYTDLTGKPTLGTAAALDIPATGNATGGQVVKGTDTRLTDARTPTTHTHTASQISDASTIGKTVLTSVDAAAVRTAIGAGTSSLALGTTGTTAAAGNDARLSDARTPTAHASSHASAGSDPVTLAASQIGSGTVATARLGSGTASSTTFLRGDQTWATPAGGGTVTSVTAGDATITVGGTAADPTIAVNAIAESKVTNLVTDLAAKAPLASPTFTGTVTIPTATAADSSTKAASTAFVQGELTAKAPLASPTFTGTPAAPTATGGTNTTQVATTAFVASAVSPLAPLASPTFTGTPAAPTATGGTNTTQVATTAFVASAVSPLAPLASPTFTGHPVGVTETAGTNSTRLATTAYADNAVAKQPEVFMVAVSDETTALTTGTAKVTFRMPFAMTLTSVRSSLTTASSSGLPTVNIKESGTTIFSTNLSIDASEKTSTTAATAAVLSDTSLADDAEMTIDVTVAGTGATGLKVYFIGTRT